MDVPSGPVGKGLSALKYLSCYLYRGVILENNMVSSQDGNVTFKYVEIRTGKTRYRTVKGEDFLWLVLQHVLPKGLRRVRDYGFLHGNAKKLLSLAQLVLQALIEACLPRDPDRYLSAPGVKHLCKSGLLGGLPGHQDNKLQRREPATHSTTGGCASLMT